MNNPFREAVAKAVPQIDHQSKVLLLLNSLKGQHLYRGTANPNKVAKRRAKNKVAKQSRKLNRP